VSRRLVAIRVAYLVGVAITLLWAPIRHFPPFGAYGSWGDVLFGSFAQWDSGWFIGIAQHGYAGKQAAAFFPLYPLVVHGVAFVVRSTLVAGVLVSLASAAATAELLFRIARARLGEAAARDAVLLLALYPLAFVFTAVYSDGLFLALTTGAFYAAQRRRPLAAGVLGALAVATRLLGLALLPALLILLWPRTRRPRDLAAPLALLLLPAALGAYAYYLHRHFGDAFAFAHAEGAYWQRHTPALGPLTGLWEALRSGEQGLAELVRHLPRHGGGSHGFAYRDRWATWNVVQLLLLLCGGWLTWVAWRRLGAAFGAYSAATLLIVLSSPADVIPLVSLPRFLLADFPLFIALAALLESRPKLREALIVVFAAVGAVAAVAFSRAVWVA
jgi:hypothetical protein